MTSTYQAMCGCVHRTQTQIRSQYLPYNLGLEPYVRLGTAHFDIPSHALDLERLQRIVEFG